MCTDDQKVDDEIEAGKCSFLSFLRQNRYLIESYATRAHFFQEDVYGGIPEVSECVNTLHKLLMRKSRKYSDYVINVTKNKPDDQVKRSRKAMARLVFCENFEVK